MSEQVISAKEALCAGMDTSLFYMRDDELGLIDMELKDLRRICFACPIMKECLSYGFKKEKHGMFGGVTEFERDLLKQRRMKDPKALKLFSDLIILNFPISLIINTMNGD